MKYRNERRFEAQRTGTKQIAEMLGVSFRTRTISRRIVSSRLRVSVFFTVVSPSLNIYDRFRPPSSRRSTMRRIMRTTFPSCNFIAITRRILLLALRSTNFYEP